MEKLIKKLREIIKKLKKLKNNFLTHPVKFFRIFFDGPIDLGHDHALF